MDVNIKVPIDDLKFSFSKILNTDLFAKKLIYKFKKQEDLEIDIDSSKSLQE